MRFSPDTGAATLLMSLILLVIMSIYAVSSTDISTMNVKIVGNMQNQRVMEASAEQALEETISDASMVSATVARTVNVGAFSVNVAVPTCISSEAVSGFSAAWSLAPESDVWDISAAVTDNVTGATSTIHQGIKMRMLAGSCP